MAGMTLSTRKYPLLVLRMNLSEHSRSQMMGWTKELWKRILFLPETRTEDQIWQQTCIPVLLLRLHGAAAEKTRQEKDETEAEAEAAEDKVRNIIGVLLQHKLRCRMFMISVGLATFRKRQNNHIGASHTIAVSKLQGALRPLAKDVAEATRLDMVAIGSEC